MQFYTVIKNNSELNYVCLQLDLKNCIEIVLRLLCSISVHVQKIGAKTYYVL